MLQKVFVIYGRDEDAHRELSLFIRSLGLEELTFDEAANSLGANPFVADVVEAGVNSADLIIALFTPDEQAALYSCRGRFVTHDLKGAEAAAPAVRWQARPNVIFEAGWAYGNNRNKTILVTLGADISLFSDVSGIHFIRLDNEQGKKKLRDRIGRLVTIVPQPPNWMDPQISGDFIACRRIRWAFYDELDSLETRLQAAKIGKNEISLSWIVLAVASDAVAMHKPIGAGPFMRLIGDLYGNAITDAAYWELIISGFLEFLDIGKGPEGWGIYESERWQSSAPYAQVAKRGEMLLAKFADVGDFTLRLEEPILQKHKEVHALILQQRYEDAKVLNSNILQAHPTSPRAYFNQARIYAQLAKTMPASAELYLLVSRQCLASAIDHEIVKLLVLSGDPKERKNPLDVIRREADLKPLFKRWSDLVLKVAKSKYIRQRIGGSGGCVEGMMLVELPENRQKTASNLAIGDKVMAWDTKNATKAEAAVVAVKHHISSDGLLINDKYSFTGVHPILTRKGWIKARRITPGTEMRLGSGDLERVTSVQRIREPRLVVDIKVNPYSTFIAGGVVVHNALK